MPSLDDFLQRKPLSDENAALLRGEQPSVPAPTLPPAVVSEDELQDDERQWLRRLMSEPGWPVYVRLTKRLVQQAERNAMLLSQNSNVSDGAEILSAWNAVRALRTATEYAIRQAEFEVSLLQRESRKEA